MQDLAHLSDDELVAELFACCFNLRRLTARALVFLGEVEERRIDLKSACSSLHDYCRRKLSMSDGQAHRHVTGARLARRFPFLLEKIESGELCLSTLVHIKDFITDENVHELLADCVGKTRNQVDRMLGERFGKEPPRYVASAELVPYDRELEKMMDRARELFSHAVPDGDPVELAKRAFALLIEQGEKEKRGKAEKPRPSPAKVTKTKSVPREAIRAMYARYGEECSYVDERTGECCRSRAFLEIEHIDPRALGGTHDVENLRPLCRAHNRLWRSSSTGAITSSAASEVGWFRRHDPIVMGETARFGPKSATDAGAGAAVRTLLHLWSQCFRACSPSSLWP